MYRGNMPNQRTMKARKINKISCNNKIKNKQKNFNMHS